MLKLMSIALVALSISASPGYSAQFKFVPDGGLDLTGKGGTSQVRGDCTFGTDGIARCEDCEVDWDGPVPEMICIANMLCYDHYGKPVPC